MKMNHDQTESETKMERYDGTEDVTWNNLIVYLMDNFHDENGDSLTNHRAIIAAREHIEVYERAKSLSSYAYYAGDKIAEQAGLLWIPRADDTAYWQGRTS